MRISVFGLGYVGAVSSGCLAGAGHRVIGVDLSADKITMLNRGTSPIVEADIGELIATAAAAGQLTATDDVARAVAETAPSMASPRKSAPRSAINPAPTRSSCAPPCRPGRPRTA